MKQNVINEGYSHPRHDSFCIVPFDPKSRKYRTDIAKPQYFHDDIEAGNVARKLINNLPENCVVLLLGMGENRQWEELNWFEHKKTNKNMKKNTIKLNESQLRNIIKESIKKVLNEDACAWAVLDSEGEIIAQFVNQNDAYKFLESEPNYACEIVPLGKNGYIMPYENADVDEY